jgi:hypothetical protein
VWSHWHHRCLSSPPLHSATLTLTWYDSHVGAFVFSLSFLWNAFPLPHLVYSCLSWAQLRFFTSLRNAFWNPRQSHRCATSVQTGPLSFPHLSRLFTEAPKNSSDVKC